MLTIALLAGLGNDHELAIHIRATRNTGATPGRRAGGAPPRRHLRGRAPANHAFRIAKETFAAMARERPEEIEAP